MIIAYRCVVEADLTWVGMVDVDKIMMVNRRESLLFVGYILMSFEPL